MKKARKVDTKPASETSDSNLTTSSTAAERESEIAVAAYYIAERRGFAPGFELEDWLTAELQLRNGST